MKFIERQRHFLAYSASSLLRHKARNGALVLAFALAVFLLASVMFFVRSLRFEAQALLENSPDVLIQNMVAGRHELIPVAWAEQIAAFRGVVGVKPRLWGYYYQAAARMNLTLMAREDFPYGDDQVIVGNTALRVWRDSLGASEDILRFRAHDGSPLAFSVAEVLDPATDLVSADLVITSASAFRALTGIPEGMATDLAVTVRNKIECPTIAEKILLKFPGTRPIQREEILRTYASIFDWRGGYVILAYSGAFLALLVFVWGKATGLSAEERREIGILKAIGWDTADILQAKFWEGICISTTAFFLGVLAAYIHVFFGSAFLLAQALKGWSVLSPRLVLYPRVSLTEIMSLLLLAVVPYALATAIPAWRTATTDPDRIIRGV